MRYTDGAPCSNGGPRQTKLILRCIQRMPLMATPAVSGIGEPSAHSAVASAVQSPLLPPTSFFLRHVLEGSRCSYTARLYTPLVCSRGYRTSKKLKRFRRQKKLEIERAATLRRPRTRGRMPALDPTISLRTAVQQHQRASTSLQSRIAFHAAVSERERCIQRWVALMQENRRTQTARFTRGPSDGAEEIDSESVSPKRVRRKTAPVVGSLASAGSSSSSSLSLLRVKQQRAVIDSACARFRSTPP